MSDRYQVISAFLDDEPFDARELMTALGDEAGRALLVDLVALRHLACGEAGGMVARRAPRPWRSTLRGLAAAAAILVALAGGYVAGSRRHDAAVSTAPAATRVVQASGSWQDVPSGRMP